MVLPHIEARSELISYHVDEGDGVLEALIDAFNAIDVDVYEMETTVDDWTSSCPIETIDWDADEPYRISTVIWDHPTVVTSDEIRIFE
jgi:predicted ATP-grasp superfamily ATP-dependent carboligase